MNSPTCVKVIEDVGAFVSSIYHMFETFHRNKFTVDRTVAK